MHSRISAIGAVALTLAAVASAEPAKPEARPSVQATSRPPELVMASAEQARTPAAVATDQTQPATSAPVKKRAARVTSCRCADQVPSGQ
jgi:hypothetical protein